MIGKFGQNNKIISQNQIKYHKKLKKLLKQLMEEVKLYIKMVKLRMFITWKANDFQIRKNLKLKKKNLRK